MTALHRGSLGTASDGDGSLVRVERHPAGSELDEFVYIVSHDLRNSARALSEVPKWLKEDLIAQGVKLGQDMSENFDLLERHARRLDQMLLDLLMYSRVGRLQEMSEISIAELVTHVLSETSLPDYVTVDISAQSDVLRMGYKDAFTLFNAVLDNVVRHGATAESRLQIRAQRRGSAVSLTFSDNGPGIEPHDLQRVFRPMTTLVRRDDCEGSGMGLAIIQRIVEHYGGEILAGRVPDGGGFRLRIRLRDSPVFKERSDVESVEEEGLITR